VWKLRVIFTGATSFTGTWFVRALAAQGDVVIAAIRGEEASYSGLRNERLKRVADLAKPVWGVTFGSDAFLALVRQSGPFDVLCHHAAEVSNYKSPDFDAIAAAASNTRAIRTVCQALCEAGCKRIVLTGSVFEAGEGAGNLPLRAFSSYGLSKTITAQTFAFYAKEAGLALGKFVIPNPFGPFEEPRFTDYLMRTWKEGKTAGVSTPAYVRDNIHVSLLSAVYARFVQTLPESGYHKVNPSGYVESQGAFASRFAAEMSIRLNLETRLSFAKQTEFPEPQVRINTDPVSAPDYDWNERDAWDELAGYYRDRLGVANR
jgi:UDP-glucose 4-epimerase